MITKEKIVQECGAVFGSCSGNRVDIPGTGMTDLFEMPLIGIARADDPLFEQYKQPEVIGPVFMPPCDWLPGARSVVSFFFPFTEEVRVSNRDSDMPSAEWLYARIEGQQFINDFISAVRDRFEGQGIRACVPSLDERFRLQMEQVLDGGTADIHADSAWSERHAAYACGLGTFGLSRGLITERGMAGRITSIIVDAEIEPDSRAYTGVYEYCIRCGVCAANCPAGAITLDYGKNNIKCNDYVNMTKEKFAPRYGCGKCQVGVPCEFCRP